MPVLTTGLVPYRARPVSGVMLPSLLLCLSRRMTGGGCEAAVCAVWRSVAALLAVRRSHAGGGRVQGGQLAVGGGVWVAAALPWVCQGGASW
jgi:hypothetical protein